MTTPYDLQQLRQRLDRLERELAETRNTLESLSAQAAAPATEAPAVPARETVALPAEPPPLPTAPPAPAIRDFPIHAAAASGAPVAATSRSVGNEKGQVEPVRTGVSPVRVWLERLQLWPPQDDTDAEVRLGAWWATRLGTLFAVIGVVFFGVYLSLDTPPWVKLLELAAIAGAVVGLGWWAERRLSRFGRVIFAGGLALVFFTAFAAYTVPAVKVLDSRLAALAWQLAACVLIGAVAWRRRAPAEATLAVALGFVAAIFSLSGGLQLAALGAAAGLALTSVVWYRWLNWPAPSFVALAGYWTVYGLLVAGLGRATTPLLPTWVWGFVLLGFLLFFWRDDPWGKRVVSSVAERRWMQNGNSTAALIAGWVTAWVGFPEQVEWFYAGAAVVLGLAAWRRWQVDAADAIGPVLLAKASGALTLAVIAWSDGRATELSLLVQAAVMLAGYAWLRSRVLGISAGVVWGLSALYRAVDLSFETLAIDSLTAWGAIAHSVGSVIWLLEARRLTLPRSPAVAATLDRLVLVTALAWAVATSLQIRPLDFLPHRLVLSAAIVIGLLWHWRARSLAVSAGVLGVSAHLSLWAFLPDEGVRYAWEAAAVVLGPSLLAAAFLARRADRASVTARTPRIAWAVSALAIITGVVLAWKTLPVPAVAGLVALTAAALAGLAPGRPQRGWMWLAAWAIAVGSVALVIGVDAEGASIGWWGAAFVWVGVAVTQAWPAGALQLERESARQGPQLAVVTSGFALALFAWWHADPSTGFWLAGALALLAVGLLTWTWVSGLAVAAWGLWLSMIVVLAERPFLTLAAAVAVAGSWLPILVWGLCRSLSPRPAKGAARIDVFTAQAWVAGVVTLAAIGLTQDGVHRLAATLAALLVLTALSAWRMRKLATVVWLYVLAAWCWAAVAVRLDPAAAHWSSLSLVVVVAAFVIAAVPLVLPRGRSARSWWTGGAAALALGLAVAWAAGQAGALEPLVTVLWGASSLVVFALGILARSRSHRLWGLAGILICIPRVFLVDLQSTLHRIAAFAVLGLVLLWVGFSYHRFRRWITEEHRPRSDAGKV